jgi:hypothetical protein
MADVQTFVADENLAPVKKAMKFCIVIEFQRMNNF